MNERPSTVLVVGSTGSIGQLVVEEALDEGYAVRALVRDRDKARQLPSETESVVGDLTEPETIPAAVDGVDAIVFTHGSNDGGEAGPENVDYGGVRNILAALGDQQVRIALMTAIGVTNRTDKDGQAIEVHDWERRSERLVRASDHPYTIVRPGWFDYNDSDQHQLVLLQGDTRRAGDPSDGVVARNQIAEVLVRSLSSEAAERTTFELVAEQGPPPEDFESLFATLDRDSATALDGVRDTENMPVAEEADEVRADLEQLTTWQRDE